MAKRVLHIRHTTAEADTFTGKEGEITVDLDNDEMRLHDGVKKGGIATARKDLANVIQATTSVDGKMTAAHVIELAAATLDLANEIARALAAEGVLQGNINQEVTDRNTAIGVETTNRIADVDAEETRAIAAELVLQNQVTPNTSKLAGIEANATQDQTGSEIKALYEVLSKAFTNTQFDKLAAIETAATADQSNAEIKTAYEANSNTNAFTDALLTLLNNQSGVNTGDEPDATTSAKGVAELATVAEAEAGTDANRVTTPASLASVIANALNAVLKTGNQTIAGIKTFSSTLVGNISGSSGSCTGNAATATLANNVVDGVLAEVKFTPITAGTAYDYTALSAETSTTATIYVATAIKLVVQRSGTYRLTFAVKTAGGGQTAFARLYKDGVAFGTEHSTASTSYVTKTEDIALTAHETYTLYIRTTNVIADAYVKDAVFQSATKLFG